MGLTLALMVSYTPAIPEDIRSQVLFFTAGIVTLTLCINATTTRWLLGKLGLIHVPSARILMERRVQERIRESGEKYFERLKTREPLAGANWKKVAGYVAPLPDKAPLSAARSQDVLAELRLRVLDREKAFSREIYDEGIISQTAFRRLMNSLDELYDHDGTYPLDLRRSISISVAARRRSTACRNCPTSAAGRASTSASASWSSTTWAAVSSFCSAKT